MGRTFFLLLVLSANALAADPRGRPAVLRNMERLFLLARKHVLDSHDLGHEPVVVPQDQRAAGGQATGSQRRVIASKASVAPRPTCTRGSWLER